jgi:branched-subunit amino acid aminotransferase/4-amino-4-deoxychorismate lyase
MGQPADWLLPLRKDIESWLCQATAHQDAALRMVLHADSRLLYARLEPLPIPSQPYRLVLMPHPLGERLGDPAITHKGLSGPWGMEVLASARSLGADDALLLWPDGSLAETAIAAVGVELNGILRVPPPPGRVASLAERLDLPAWAVSRNLRIERQGIPPSLAREGQVWCMNALRGIWPAVLL